MNSATDLSVDKLIPLSFRLSSSGSTDASNDTSTNHAESYFLRRENRLSARKKAEEETANNDYKKAGDAVCMLVRIRATVVWCSRNTINEPT